MNPQHRDRIAFLRIASGKFRRGMKLKQMATGKAIAINSPIFFFAQDREIADEAFPGDIIGIPNHGVLRVGDSLVEKDDVTFTGIPNFAPEILRRVALKDPTKSKQLRTALTDMAEEGVTQLFKPMIGSQWIVGVVGQLQLEVLISRLEAEYRVAAGFEPSPFETARWISGEPDGTETLHGRTPRRHGRRSRRRPGVHGAGRMGAELHLATRNRDPLQRDARAGMKVSRASGGWGLGRQTPFDL